MTLLGEHRGPDVPTDPQGVGGTAAPAAAAHRTGTPALRGAGPPAPAAGAGR